MITSEQFYELKLGDKFYYCGESLNITCLEVCDDVDFFINEINIDDDDVSLETPKEKKIPIKIGTTQVVSLKITICDGIVTKAEVI